MVDDPFGLWLPDVGLRLGALLAESLGKTSDDGGLGFEGTRGLEAENMFDFLSNWEAPRW